MLPRRTPRLPPPWPGRGRGVGSGALRRGLRASVLVVALAVLAVPTAVPTAALADEDDGEQVQARGIERVCPPPDTPAEDVEAFADVGEPHLGSIECAAAYGLVAGFDDGTYRPSVDVTRDQVATFVAGWLRTATGISLPTPDEPHFDDIEGNVHADSIEALAEAGVVGGRGDGVFAPDDDVTRGQFARIVVNAISYADVFAVDGPLPPAAEAPFTDVAGTTFEAEIGALAGAGVVLGGEDGTYAPHAPVTRGQLATFLMRAADYADRHQRWKPTSSVQVLMAELTVTAADDGEAGAEPAGTAVLTVNAFNGTLAYTLELSGVDAGFGDTGAVLRSVADGEVFLELADGEALTEAVERAGFVTDEVFEADSLRRFADLVHAPGEAEVWVALDDGTALRGTLRHTS